MYCDKHDDLFEYELKLKKLKQEKKIAKKLRLEQKKKLIEEIKQTSSVSSRTIEGSEEWALEILGVNKLDSYAQVKSNYFKLAQLHHPDKNYGVDTQEMKNVNAAWEILKNKF
jgi:DnaJ-class molecular chaperone